MEIKFTWDPEKARKNLAKHGVSFETAQEAFYDPYVLFVDNLDTGDEQRYMAIDRTAKQQLLAVICLDLSSNEEQHFHVISAWEAEEYEQRAYADQF